MANSPCFVIEVEFVDCPQVAIGGSDFVTDQTANAMLRGTSYVSAGCFQILRCRRFLPGRQHLYKRLRKEIIGSGFLRFRARILICNVAMTVAEVFATGLPRIRENQKFGIMF